MRQRLIPLRRYQWRDERYRLVPICRGSRFAVRPTVRHRHCSNRHRGAAGCYAITTDTTNGAPYAGVGATAPVCTATVGTAATRAIATADLAAWDNALKGSSEQQGASLVGAVLGARGCVSYDATTNSYRVAVAWQGMAPTVAPTAGDAAATCGKNLYGSEAQRREVNMVVRIANLT